MQKKLVTDPIIDAISVDAAWTLVETFSTMPRWRTFPEYALFMVMGLALCAKASGNF